MNGGWIFKMSDPPPEFWTPHVFCCRYEKDATRFMQLLSDAGAELISLQVAPFLNMRGHGVGTQFVILYQYTEPLSMEVMT